jgi:type II secretory pathway component PulC
VLVSINQEPVHSPEDAANKLRQLSKSPQKTALLLLNRRGVTQYVGVKLNKDEG